MKRLFGILLVAALGTSASAVTKNKQFEIYDFHKGLDSYQAPTAIPDGYVQNSLNVLFDDVAPATKRAGYTVAWSTQAYQYTGLWTYTDPTNTTWQIARSSDQITATNLAGTVVNIATVSVNNLVGETNGFGYAFFTDQTQGIYYWNGSSTTYETNYPQAPLGSIITQFHGRIAVTGAAVPNQDELYLSTYYDAISTNAWNTAQPGFPVTEAAFYPIGLQDNFDNVTAEYVYLDTLYLFKHSSIFALYGFDQSSFQTSQLTQECGCIDGGSIQTYNSALEFVSLRGVESFNGYSCTRISDLIKNKIDPAIAGDSYSQQSWVQQQASDWQSGTIAPTGSLSTTIAAPALVLASSSSADVFANGTFSNTTTNGSGDVALTQSSSQLVNNSFESGQTTGWTVTAGSWLNETTPTVPLCALTAYDGSYFEQSGGNLFSNNDLVSIYSCSGSLLSSQVISASGDCSGWQTNTIPMSSYDGQCVQVQFTDGTGDTIISNDFNSNGANLTFQAAWAGHNGSPPALGPIFIDFISGSPRTIISTGTFTSQVFNTGIANPLVTVAASTTTNTEAIHFVIQDSTASTGPWTTIGSAIGGPYQGEGQYVQYIASFSAVSTDTVNSSLNSFNWSATADSGTLASPIHNISGSFTWGNFSVVNALNNGNIAFSICSSANSNMSPDVCAVQAPNSQITISTGAYVQWYSTFTVTASTDNPTLNSVTVQWFSGNKPVPMVSIVWDNRYWLSLTTTTADSSNDAVMVLNHTGGWSIFDIHAGAFTQYKNQLYHADSNPTGNIYLDNQGFSDNGNAINAFLTTKNEGLGDLGSDDYLYAIYPSASSTGNCAMSLSYTMDINSQNYQLASPLLSEFNSFTSVRLPFPIDSSHQDFGQSVSFTVGTDDSQCAWQFIGLEGLYKQRPLQ